jgi:hypothetical protein
MLASLVTTVSPMPFSNETFALTAPDEMTRPALDGIREEKKEGQRRAALL